MTRPRGYRLNRQALTDILKAKRLSMSEAAEFSGIGLTTLSNLVHSGTRASIKTARALEDGIGCSAETLFPELANFEPPPPDPVEDPQSPSELAS